MNEKRIAIFGAGSTGCYLGALLSLAGLNVSLICREKIKQEIEQNKGIRVTKFDGFDQTVMPAQLYTSVQNQQFDIVFVMLKCHSLGNTFEQILSVANDKSSNRPSQLVFMQNGLGSLEPFLAKLSQYHYSTGITSFNVLHQKPAHFHQGTQGPFIFEHFEGADNIKKAMRERNLACRLVSADEIKSIVFGKILLNLNNALNAISNLPIKQELADKKYRHLLGKAGKEWLNVCDAMGVEPAALGGVNPKKVPKMMLAPNWLFRLLSKKMITIDPLARSSMWDDIQAGRKTEIEFINGSVVRLGQKYGVDTPVNRMICEQIKCLEAGKTVVLK